MENKMDTLDWFIFITTGIRYEYGEWKPFIIEKDGRFKPRKEREVTKKYFWGMKRIKSKEESHFITRVFVCFDSLQKCKDFINYKPEKEIRHEL